MPVETAITSSGAILVLEAIVETETENCGRRDPVTEQPEELCLDCEKLIICPRSTRGAWHIRSSLDQGDEEE
jgi:hypothetical protein